LFIIRKLELFHKKSSSEISKLFQTTVTLPHPVAVPNLNWFLKRAILEFCATPDVWLVQSSAKLPAQTSLAEKICVKKSVVFWITRCPLTIQNSLVIQAIQADNPRY